MDDGTPDMYWRLVWMVKVDARLQGAARSVSKGWGRSSSWRLTTWQAFLRMHRSTIATAIDWRCIPYFALN